MTRTMGAAGVVRRLTAWAAVGALLLAGCGSSSSKHPKSADSSSTASAAHNATSSTAPARLETVTRNGAVVVVSPGVAYSVEEDEQAKAALFAPGDAVTINEEEEITDLRTGKRVSATEIGDTTEANVYPHGGSTHRLRTLSPDGRIVVLGDESVWAVSPADWSTAASWAAGASIAVPKRSHLLYGLTNTADNSVVRANYIGEEES